jgi:hypothetical protein
MTLLPIVERELRVKARQWPTYWSRVGIGLFGTLLCLQQLEVGGMVGSAAEAGRFAFRGLLVVSLLVCSLGCLVTADAISWERREKTLGLLFLTRIGCADILLGKLASAALVVLGALVAFLPVLMIPVLAGGVTGGEAFRIGLVLVDTLLLSLAAGLVASARRVEWFKSAQVAVGLMAALIFVPPVMERLFFPKNTVGLLSPLWGVSAASDGAKLPFWISLAAVQGLAWVLFWQAWMRLRVAVRDDAVENPIPRKPPRVLAEENAPVRRPLLHVGVQPIGWLMHRQRGISRILWAGAACSVVLSGSRYFPMAVGGTGWMVWSILWPLSFAGTVVSGGLFAWATSRFLFEARRSGEFELLITTPVGAKTIVWEQWLFLRRALRGPLILMLAPMVLQVFPLWFGFGFRMSFGGLTLVTALLSTLFMIVSTVLGLVALCWAGMWFGLKARTQGTAVLLTVAWVKGGPYLFSLFWSLLSRLLIGTVFSPALWSYVVYSWIPQVLILGFYFWLIWWMRARLLGEIRDAEAVPLTLRGDLKNRWGALTRWLKRARHWTPS